MAELKQYVISITAAAMLCGIVSSLVKNTSGKEAVRLLCGLLLSFTMLRPLSGIDVSQLAQNFSSYFQMEDWATAAGQASANDALEDIIKAKTEAYILDKAAELRADIKVEVSLSREELPVPVGVTISGQVSPYARQQLTAMIQADLGITKENQVWTG